MPELKRSLKGDTMHEPGIPVFCLGGIALSCYFIACINIHDQPEYEKYLAQVDEVFARFNGKYLAVDSSPETLEGAPGAGRIVLIEFPSRDELLRWYRSPDYQAILKHRLVAADCKAAILNGLD